MKNLRSQLLILFVCVICLVSSADGQLTPSGDAYTNTAMPTTNYGAKTLLDVESSQTSYIQFNLSSIPSGYTGADITKATLKLYVNSVTTAGSFNVDYVNGTWSENTIDASNAPALGTTIAASVPLITADKNQYILIDITTAVQAWLSGTANDGIALVGNSPVNATFDSKESTTTSHAAELDIVFTPGSGGGGGIAGINTGAGSGLMGGGNSGTLNLSLINTCSAKQILQWSGSAWACASPGTGTVTSVASGAGLTGGPITSSGTLSIATAGVTNSMLTNPSLTVSAGTALTGGGSVALGSSTALSLDTSKVPLLAAANSFSNNQTVNGTVTASSFSGNGAALTNVTANNSNELGGLAPGAFAQLAAANTFSNNQTLNGALTASSGSDTIYATSTSNSAAAVFGNELSSTGSTFGVIGQSASSSGYGVYGDAYATSGTTFGVYGGNASTSGFGVYGSSPNMGVGGYSSGSTGTTYGVIGQSASSAGNGVYGYASATSGKTHGVYGQSASTSGTGVYGTSPFTGVQGIQGGVSNVGAGFGGNAGVWGDTDAAGTSSAAVLATADNNVSGYFVDASSGAPTLVVENRDTTVGDEVFRAYMSDVGIPVIIGDPGCSGNGLFFIALQLGNNDGMSNCNNYTLIGGSNGHTYMNAIGGAAVHLRISNVDQLIATAGNVDILGTLSKGGGSFKIDHPLDPANKYLYHSFVESPDMMNIYNGNVTTGASGEAAVELPEWFETLNRDFRYQLTVIGQFAQAIVAGKVANHQFIIKTDKPNVEVSWQVTGIRQDAFANAHRIPVESEKVPADRGHYLYPELVGAPETARIGYMAPALGSEKVVHSRPTIQKRSDASPAQLRTPPMIPVPPPVPVAPKVAPRAHQIAQPSKLGIPQR